MACKSDFHVGLRIAVSFAFPPPYGNSCKSYPMRICPGVRSAEFPSVLPEVHRLQLHHALGSLSGENRREFVRKNNFAHQQ